MPSGAWRIIEQRCLTGRTGATWQAETVHACWSAEPAGPDDGAAGR